MTDNMIEQANKRAVACRGWRWTPGMRTVDAMRVIHDPDRWPDRPCALREGGWIDTAPPRPLGDDLPDFADPATIGCLLALVREAWGQDDMGASRYHGRWCIEVTPREGQHYAFYGDTEAEALVAALKAAP
jgi:hypothetical protein